MKLTLNDFSSLAGIRNIGTRRDAVLNFNVFNPGISDFRSFFTPHVGRVADNGEARRGSPLDFINSVFHPR